MAKKDHPAMNKHVPRKGTKIGSYFGSFILNIIGWKIKGQFPNEKKIIIVGAPHTSNWDFIIAMSAVMALRLKFKFMMKKQAFFWPFSIFWKYLGGVPIDRSRKNDITTQMTEWFNSQDNAYLGLTPEGTRSKVLGYKKGYLRIAYASEVPIFLIGIDGDNKEISLDRIWPLCNDIKKDNDAIKAYFDKTYSGIRPELG